MFKVMRATVPVGFVFGIVITLFAFGVGYLEEPFFLVIVPILAGFMSGVGGLVAWFVDSILAARGVGSKKTRQIMGFFAAAAINSSIVFYFVLNFSEGVIFYREIFLFTFMGFGLGAVYGIYRYRIDRLDERMRFLEELNEKNRRIEEASRHLAIIEERNRMGRELHDSIAQGLHGITFSVKSLRNEIKEPSPKVQAIIYHLETAAKATLDELRTLIDELKPSLLAEKGLNEAVRVMADLFSQRQQVPVEVNIKTGRRISPKIEMVVYRVCQEALANIEKHASPKNVNIDVVADRNNLFLVIKDDGVGVNSKSLSLGNGLTNMRRRVEDVGGNIDIVSIVGLGTSVVINIPFKTEG